MDDGFVFDGYAQLKSSDFPTRDQAILLLERDVSWLRWFYLPFERNYDGLQLLLWSRKHYSLAPVFCFIYFAMIWFGPRIMAKRRAWELRAPLKYWNLALAVFSACGCARVMPHLIVQSLKFGFRTTMCSPPVFTYGRGAVGLWTGMFIYSKYFELIDTAFIILRKRNLNFLHWYHHVTVLMYTWDAFVTEQPPGLLYCGMNYTVHAIMYFYYYLASMKIKPPKWGIIVTLLQIGQMIIGVVATALGLYFAFTRPFMQHSTAAISRNPASVGTCFISKSNMASAAAMYSTYFYLFAKFFYTRYVKPSSKQKSV